MIVSIIMTVIALGGFLWGMHRFSYVILLGLFLMVLGFSYISARLYVKKQPEKNNQVMTIYTRFALIFYFFFLFSLTFNVNRDAVRITLDKTILIKRLKEEANLIPFKTILDILKTNYPSSFVIIQIVGNIGALMPLGVLFPLVFQKARRVIPFTFMVIGMVLFIEFVQFVFNVGRLDIDDLILNLFGALIAYGIYNIACKIIER
ncbi:MAG: VanZ family protein, partial [Pseudobutyrivibrio sp.]|nr:VanZ family protein [Pseudobutyrivibrio sp.]